MPQSISEHNKVILVETKELTIEVFPYWGRGHYRKCAEPRCNRRLCKENRSGFCFEHFKDAAKREKEKQ